MEEVARGVYRIVRGPFRIANAYLIEDVLVDGITRWTGPYLLRQLIGRPLSLVALTHAHPDHQGAVARVCRARQVPLACHEQDVEAMEGRAPMLGNSLVNQAGRLWAGPPYPVRRVLRHGDDVAGFRVLHTPGHTAGHIVLFREADRVAICGDLLHNAQPPASRARLAEPPAYLSADPRQNRRSIELLAALEPAVACFGHGPVLRDPAQFTAFVERLHLEGVPRAGHPRC